MSENQRILEVATSIYKQKGIRFTMQDVAEELHIAKKTIYKIYPSKEILLLDLIEVAFYQIHQCKAAIMELDLPIEEKIKQVIIAMPEEYASLDFKDFEDLGTKYPSVEEALKRNLETNWDPTIQLIEQGIQEGKIKPINMTVLRTMITASIEALLSESSYQKDGLTYYQALDEMMEIVMGGIIKYDSIK